MFEPIAIVGQGCVLPGALDVVAFRDLVLQGQSRITGAPPGRWRLAPRHAMGTPQDHVDRAWSDAGGYVDGFEKVFDPAGFHLPADVVRGLDPGVQWVLHAGRTALHSMGYEGRSARAGLVLGNLSFPTASLTRYAESVWLDQQGASLLGGRARSLAGVDRPDARNRFMSGLSAHLAASALGLELGGFSLDAACASSLYAIKLACDRLHDRTADVMVAGAVNAADSLFLHVGFCSLAAMSKSGRSRPFHRDADGLVPAEGAALLVLKRLGDARAANDRILGVIRGVGLSNDGRGRGLLAPSQEGQVRAMRLAYGMSGRAPSDVSLVECHATGTPVGDATEVRAMAAVFEGAHEVPIGSFKSNVGHLITAAGAAGVMKVIAAMDAGTRPPTLNADAPISALSGTPFRLVTAPEKWTSDRPRLASVSAFGFGGNNAHILVEEPGGDSAAHPVFVGRHKPAVAIVAIGAMLGDTTGAEEAAAAVLAGRSWRPRREKMSVALEGVRFPPLDLEKSLPQQLLLLEAAREACAGLTFARERTGVLVGMGCDAEIARYGARWRVAEWVDAWCARTGDEVPQGFLAAARDAFQSRLVAAGVVGTMPNIPANRVNAQLDLCGPGFTVSSEEASGIVALELAARALREGELDAAIVGAVDFSDEPVQHAALTELEHEAPQGDAAVVLVLERLDDARARGHRVIAVLDEGTGKPTLRLGEGEGAVDPFAQGKAHAASGLLQVAAAAWSVHHGARPESDRAASPWSGPRVAEAGTPVLGGALTSVRIRADGPAEPLHAERPPRLWVYSGTSRTEVLRALENSQESNAGPMRLVVVASGAEEHTARAAQARRHLEAGGPLPEGVAFRESPIGGELAFVFTGAAAGYQGMGRDVALAMPDALASLASRCASLEEATSWVFGPTGEPSHPLDQLWASTFLCQLHAEVTRGILGLRPHATIGYSSGESNALFAMGAWRDLDAMMRESRTGPIFNTEIAGEFAAARRVWARLGFESGTWRAWSVAASPATVQEALRGEPLAHLTIVNSPDECVIGGEVSACDRVLTKLGRDKAVPLGYAMAAHCPEIEEIRRPWYELHHRQTWDVPEVRFYSVGSGASYRATADAAAEAITAQAVRTLDFPRVIERAYADGVRVFLEHGPRGLCSGWIKRILGDRDHVAVPLDVAGRNGIRQLHNAAAWLVASGVPLDPAALERAVGYRPPTSAYAGPALTIPAHALEVRLPSWAESTQRMAPAPTLVSTLSDFQPLPPPAAESLPVPTPVPVPVRAPAPQVVVTPPPPPAPAATPALVPVAAADAVVVRPAPAAPPPRAATRAPTSDVLARVAEEHARLAAVHREFLDAQAAAHSRFLAFQQNTLAGLLRAYGNGASTIAIPVEPARPTAHGTNGTNGTHHTPVPVKPPMAPPPLPVQARAVVPTPIPPAPTLPGPKFNRAQLEVLASGRISDVFGPLFAHQDGFVRQVRMPEPPLLLADRVTGIDAEPGSMGRGTIWTETDVTWSSWYLHEGRMPAGVMIESGQADLLLISWLGVDRLNRSERVYRLLGCELTYHGELPRPGETLVYEIHVDGHATQGDVRLMFFHYDCRVNGELRLSVRNGQAGFFTDEELANSGGVLWDAATADHGTTGPLDPPAVQCTKRAFTREDIRAFSEGRAHDCFGPGFERAQTHVRTPTIQSGKMVFLHRVTDFDPRGGPWKRGYLRAEADITPDDWYFAGHFKNDPCMPGTLMFEGCVQAMAFYLAGMGYTLDRDGWRFEPVPDVKIPMRCRGQVIPSSKHLTYEVFVEEVVAGPIPMVYADLLCTVDGLKAFHARHVGLRLVPDWPLEPWAQRPMVPASDPAYRSLELPRLGGQQGYVEPKPVASHQGFKFDYASLMACAWGKPSKAFGPVYAPFDGTRRVARLPGPPYHFMSRVTRTDTPMGVLRAGGTIEVEYDVPPQAWYFDANGHPTMPFCVLMEAALQPCGWLASYIGSALSTDIDLMFRNLDGTGTLEVEVLPPSGTLRTKVKVTDVSRSAGMIIESFAVECFLGDTRVYTMNTVFGFFPKEAFENQVGLPVTSEDTARVGQSSDFRVDLTTRPARYFDTTLRLPNPMLCMLDRVTGYAPAGGRKCLGWARAEKDVKPAEWYFKAHFYQDPVQPGSLGVEALLQLLQFVMIERGMGDGIENARFEPLALGRAVTWKYRGQVVPTNRCITTEVELTEVGEDARGRYAMAEASLWVDGKRIYHAKNLGMRIVRGEAPRPSAEEVLDPAVDTWLADHCPTWTLPALPMMSMVDRLAQGALRGSRQRVVGLSDVQVRRWLPFPGGPIRLRTEVSGTDAAREVRLLAWREARDAALSRFEPVADGRVLLADRYDPPPAPLPPLADAAPEEDPYDSGALFHGPSFRMLRSLRIGSSGASGVLDLALRGVPRGALHQGLLDALTHAIPHDALSRWSQDIPDDVVGYPYRIPTMRLFADIPESGEAQVEVRFAGFDGEPRFPKFDIQLLVNGAVCAALTLVEVLLPKGPIGRASRADRRAFLRDRRYMPGLRLSRAEGSATVASTVDVKTSDWLPGNVARIYRVPATADLVAEVALRDHVAQRAVVHPSTVQPAADLKSATVGMRPLRRHPLRVERTGDVVRVSDDGLPFTDMSLVEARWRQWMGLGAWPVEDIFFGLIERFVGDVVIADPDAFARLRGKNCLYLANHQVVVESLLFSVIASALTDVRTVTLAKAEHQDTWVGRLLKLSFSHPGAVDPRLITYFQRDDRRSAVRTIGEMTEDMKTTGKSAMVHVEGTRSLSCRQRVVTVSSAFIDMALEVGAPIIPVRFVAGLPAEELGQRLDFPVGMGRQDFWIGAPLMPEQLRGLRLKERKQVVLDAINGTGPDPSEEMPTPPDPAFSSEVEAWRAQPGANPERAVICATLANMKTYRAESTRHLVDMLRTGRFDVPDDPRGLWLARLARWLRGDDTADAEG
ncbi:MAG: beta-ketoacyl synthase N-terminal-like domain-containing protein [Myxococcota bacterium]